MIITILALLLTILPFLLLSYVDIKESEKQERRRKVWVTANKVKAIEARWPFVSVPELYYYKRSTDPNFREPFNAKTLHKLRIEHAKEIKRFLKK